MCKNLFLRDKKKGAIWLVVAKAEAVVEMKSMTKDFGVSSGCLRFAPDDILEELLGLHRNTSFF